MTKHMDLSVAAISGSALEAPPPAPAGAERRQMDLTQAVEYVKRRIRLVIQCFVIGAGVSAATALLIKPTFTATALLAVGEAEDNGQTHAGDSAVDTQIAMLQSPNFKDRALRALTADPVLRDAAASVPALDRRMKVLQESKSRLISLSFSAKSATLAADAANRIARLYVEDPALQSVQSVDDVTLQYATRIKALEAELASLANEQSAQNGIATPNESLKREESLRDQIATLKLNQNLARRRQENRRQSLAMTPPVQLVALATPPSRRSSLNPLLIVLPGSLFSVLLGIGLALTVGRLDRRIYSREDLERLLDRECAGAIPPKRLKRAGWLGRKRKSRLIYTRAVEAVVTEVILMSAPRTHVILMAGSECQRKALPTVRDCAAALARVIPRVLVIDLDFLRPSPGSSMLQAFRRDAEPFRPDTLDVLAGRRTLRDAIERKAEGYYAIDLKGEVCDDAFSLLATDSLRRMLDELYGSFDLIILDAPPASGVHETQLIATHADAALVFVRSGFSQEETVLDAVSTVSRALALAAPTKRARLWTVLVEAPVKRGAVRAYTGSTGGGARAQREPEPRGDVGRPSTSPGRISSPGATAEASTP